jgi:hypothetical protein
MPKQGPMDFRLVARAMLQAHLGNFQVALELLKQARSEVAAAGPHVCGAHLDGYGNFILRAEAFVQAMAEPHRGTDPNQPSCSHWIRGRVAAGSGRSR